MLTCLSDIILDFDGDAEPLEMEDILKYDGAKTFSELRSFEAKADTRELSLSFLSDFFPNLVKLRLNNSVIASVRDISSTFVRLRFLSLANCGLHSLDGISTLSAQLEELYLAFNRIADLTELIGLSNLRILDLEENEIQKLEDCEILQCCSSLKALTLSGNPGTNVPDYRDRIHQLLPSLVYLDEKKLKRPRPEPEPQITFAALDIPKIEKGEKCGIKPRSSEGASRDHAISEYVLDMADERPPTARAHFPDGRRDVTGSWLRPKQKLVTKGIVMPKLGRPVSSSLRSRASKG